VTSICTSVRCAKPHHILCTTPTTSARYRVQGCEDEAGLSQPAPTRRTQRWHDGEIIPSRSLARRYPWHGAFTDEARPSQQYIQLDSHSSSTWSRKKSRTWSMNTCIVIFVRTRYCDM